VYAGGWLWRENHRPRMFSIHDLARIDARLVRVRGTVRRPMTPMLRVQEKHHHTLLAPPKCKAQGHRPRRRARARELPP